MKPYRSLWLVVGIAYSLILGNSPSRAGNAERLEILHHAPVTLAQAIKIALEKYPGYALQGKLKEQDGMFYYEIELVSDDGQADIYVHPVNGLVIGAESEIGMALRLKRRWEARFEVVSRAPLSALDAMSIAHEEAKGRILEVDLRKNHKGQFFYRMKLYEGGAKHVIDVNIGSGEVIQHEIPTS